MAKSCPRIFLGPLEIPSWTTQSSGPLTASISFAPSRKAPKIKSAPTPSISTSKPNEHSDETNNNSYVFESPLESDPKRHTTAALQNLAEKPDGLECATASWSAAVLCRFGFVSPGALYRPA